MLIKASQASPEIAQVWNNLTNGYFQLNLLKEAEESILQSIEIDPNSFFSYFIFSLILIKQNELKKAELSLRKTIELKPDFADAYNRLGLILKDLSRFIEAKFFTEKAIVLNPTDVISHVNLGDILRKMGNLKEAEISTRKAIEIDPNNEKAFSTLGIILNDNGNKEGAEKLLKKAIKLNPRNKINYLNHGSILKHLGNLEEAEMSTKKAIEIEPNFTEALANLLYILIDRGKIQELIVFSNSILQKKYFDKGLQFQASIQLTISYLIQGNLYELKRNLGEAKKYIAQGAENYIKDKLNKKNSINYYKLMYKISPHLKIDKTNISLDKIPHIGESHCLSFAHQKIKMINKFKSIQPVLIKGCKAWHLGNNSNNQWKSSFNEQIKNHTYSSEIMISFGEIDCRINEGILMHCIKYGKDISDICKKTILNYLDYTETTLSKYYLNRYYFGVPAPVCSKQNLSDLDIQRKHLIKEYNSILNNEVISRGSNFIDIYSLTSNDTGDNNMIYMCDKTHLSPECLPILFKKYVRTA